MNSNFQDYVCNACHDLTMLSVDISNFAIIVALFMTLGNMKQWIY